MHLSDDGPRFDVVEPFPRPSTIRRTPGPVEQADALRGLLDERQDAVGCRPTRKPSTLRDYEDLARALVRRASSPSDLEAEERLVWTIGWCAEQRGRWRASTIRRYCAALLWAVERLAEGGRLDLSGVKWCLRDLQCRPDPRPARAAPLTSARKRQTVTRDEFGILIGALGVPRTETHRLLLGLLRYGVYLGLRPAEFLHAAVRDRRLLVRCAKATNGRSIGSRRPIILHGFNLNHLRSLAAFLVLFQKAAAAAPSWPAFFDRLRQALRRLCRAHDIEPICLYTLRHQAIANAKVHLDRLELAAFAGHASQQTASRGYARASAGWGIALVCGPDPEAILAVRPLMRRRTGAAVADAEQPLPAEAFVGEPPPLVKEAESELPRPGEAAAESTRAAGPEADEPEADDPAPFRM